MSTRGLVTIHPLTLVPNFRFGLDVYLWNEKTDSAMKFLSNDQVVTEGMFSFLLSNASQKVFIQETCLATYHDYLREQLETWLVDPRIPRVLKTAVFTETLHRQFTTAYESQSVQKMLESSTEWGEKLALLGPHVHFDGRELHRTLRHDSNFVTHSVNTAFYTYLISEHEGYGDEMVSEMCAGAMLHDIGKIIPGTIDCNQAVSQDSFQDEKECSEKSHPTEGFRRLCRAPGVTETQLMMCYQHHERPDGQGFPVRLMGKEIHLASRICAVANRFDGLSCPRDGRPAMSRLATLRVINSERNSALDLEMTTCLERRMNQTSTN